MADAQTNPWNGSPPVPPDRGDFYDLLSLLPPEQRSLLADLRRYLESDVAPIITDHWERGEFPFALIPKLAALGIAGGTIQGYGCPGLSTVGAGLVAMELARGDGSVATFFGVQSTTTSAAARSSSRFPATSIPFAVIAAEALGTAACIRMPFRSATCMRQSDVTSATPANSMSSWRTTASATRFPMTP